MVADVSTLNAVDHGANAPPDEWCDKAIQTATLADMRSDSQRWAYNTWIGKLSNCSRLLQFSDLNLSSIPPVILPDIALVKIERDTFGKITRFQYRLAGTNVVDLFGFDPTGRYFDELWHGTNYDDLCWHHAKAAEIMEPAIWVRHLPWRDDEKSAYSRALFPLSKDGKEIDMFLFVYESQVKSSLATGLQEIEPRHRRAR